jgi:hypothetical protein
LPPPGDAETAGEAPGHCHVGEVGEVLASVAGVGWR